MRFVLVNHAPPGHGSACSTCSRPLGSSYLRHVPTQRRYCDHECYRRYQPMAMAVPWQAAAGGVATYRNAIETITVLAAISSWSYMMQVGTLSRSLTGAFLSSHDLITMEGDDG
jgi:hypothetical protein